MEENIEEERETTVVLPKESVQQENLPKESVQPEDLPKQSLQAKENGEAIDPISNGPDPESPDNEIRPSYSKDSTDDLVGTEHAEYGDDGDRRSYIYVDGKQISRRSLPRILPQTSSSETRNSRYLTVPFGDLAELLTPSVILPNCALQDVPSSILELSELLQMTDYSSNLLTGWILDTFVEVIRKCQEHFMPMENQKMILIWLGYVLRLISNFGMSREELFLSLEDKFRKANEIFSVTNRVPHPENLDKNQQDTTESEPVESEGEDRPSTPETPDLKTRESHKKVRRGTRKSVFLKRRPSRHESTVSQQQKLRSSYAVTPPQEATTDDVIILMEIIYFVFGNRFQYEVIMETFADPPEIIPIVITADLTRPKEYYSGKREERSPSITGLAKKSKPLVKGEETPSSTKSKKGKLLKLASKSDYSLRGKRGKKVEMSPHEALVQNVLKMFTQPPKPVSEDEDKRKNKYKYILPLESAVDSNFYNNMKTMISYFKKGSGGFQKRQSSSTSLKKSYSPTSVKSKHSRSSV